MFKSSYNYYPSITLQSLEMSNQRTVLKICRQSQTVKSGCQRKPGKMLKMLTEGGRQNKFILTS